MARPEPQIPRNDNRAAFILLLAVVVARMMMMETFRDAFEATPGARGAPRGAGATASIILDLLGMLPALMVLHRGALDRQFGFVSRWSFIPLTLLTVLCAASAIWASDQFAAIVTSLHWCSAASMLWASAQLMHGAARVRIFGGICAGLLLVLIAQGMTYRFVELPDLKRNYEQNKEQFLKERGWEADSFTAKQFEKKVLAGEMIGFSASPNTYAALLVLLGIVTAGVVVQRVSDRDGVAWIVAGLLLLPLFGMLIWWTQSKAAYITPILAAGAFAARSVLQRHRKLIFGLAIGGALCGGIATVAIGMKHGSLPTDSLNFRWRYWVGSARLIQEHPILGVGWSNFGDSYLKHRLPDAAEEIKDPHNFLMHFATELGLVGALLALVWVVRSMWEMSEPKAESDETHDPPVATVGLIACIGVALCVGASVDFSQPAAYVAVELLKRLLSLGLISIAGILIAIRDVHRPEPDARAAPWIRNGIAVAIVMFFLHNLIDFSMFETGAMALFFVLIGSVVGTTASPSACSTLPRLCYGVAILALLGIVLVIAIPLGYAESAAMEGDTELRAGNAARAAEQYEHAFNLTPIKNSDYAIRAARASWYAHRDPAQVREMLQRAIDIDPVNPSAIRMLAALEASTPQADPKRVRDAFERYLALNPNDVTAHIDYADELSKLNLSAEASTQYREALRLNDLMHPDEPRRLPPAKIAAIKAKLLTP